MTLQKPTELQLDSARRLLALEAQGATSAQERAAAGRRVYEKIVSHLGTLIGTHAARALFARSVKLTSPAFPALGNIPLGVDASESLGDQLVLCLRDEAPEAVDETLLALFGTMLALLGTLIGDRLTARVLRDSWSDGNAIQSKETK